MKFDQKVWIVYNVRRDWIQDSPESLPLIFETKEEAEEIVESNRNKE